MHIRPAQFILWEAQTVVSIYDVHRFNDFSIVGLFRKIKLLQKPCYSITFNFNPNAKLTSAPVEHTLHYKYNCKIGEQPVFKEAYFEHKFISAN